jgi:hypothetical protein
MDEIEVPTEHLHETIQERIEEAVEDAIEGAANSWFMSVAISTSLIAVFAAISGLIAGHHSNEALIEQIKASDQWAYYQAKGIKAEIRSLPFFNGASDTAAVEKYKHEQGEIKKEAEEAQASSKAHLEKHIMLARSVTLFQVAIAIAAISTLTRKKIMWFISLGIAFLGVILFGFGIF